MERLLLEEVPVLFKNFSGNVTPYNRDGDRTFSILLEDPDLVESLIKEGWNIKSLPNNDETEATVYHLPVKLSYAGRYSPKVVVVKTNGKVSLNEGTVAMLDYTTINYIDIIVNPYEWSVNGNRGVKAYVNSLYAVIEETPLDIKYQDLDDVGGH
jgi:hypothetical protein